MKTVKASIESLLPLIKDSFENNQEITILVKGTSMTPALLDNKTVVSLQRFSGVLQKKHIYLYQMEDKTLLHRYIKTKKGTHIFRGDACLNYEYVDIKSIIGEVIKVDHKEFKVSLKTRLYLILKQLKAGIKKRIRG